MSELITIHGEEQSRVDESLADAGLPPVVGVESYCVFRASRDASQLTDGRGWSYHHHVDMAAWRGRLYVGWNSCEKDEDIWPSRELFSSSMDGKTWQPPAEMFPAGVSTCLRVYFFLAPNGRMLVLAGLRGGTDKTNEDTKGALVVRELRADHSWGEVFTLQMPTGDVKHPPVYTTSNDADFIDACRALLADTVFLEQQDRGRLLGPRRMKWHDPANWPGGKVPGDSEKWVAGKAYTFFERPDGAIIGLSKMSWVTISHDQGKSWSQPVVPPTFVTGKAKVFSHRTADGRYALVYNPSRRNRFPLAIVTGKDGANFDNMRLIQGELPIQRYAGADRSIGPQYTRGVSRWADDGSRADGSLWLVYSMSKEDIWVSRVPVPVRPDETESRIRGFSDWNIYKPKWADVMIDGDTLRLENRDPFDHAAVTRVLPRGDVKRVEFVFAPQQSSGHLEVDFVSKFGSIRAIQFAWIDSTLTANCAGDMKQLCALRAGESARLMLDIDAARATYDLSINGRGVLDSAPFALHAGDVHRMTIRTGAFRGIGGKQPVAVGTDKPSAPTGFLLAGFVAESRGE
ncbi:MAG TPA: sialidase family protein [Tepidisphaeraceae bacterium]|nr:sialidase family protein [Tepidisphaeraceae bacterium]